MMNNDEMLLFMESDGEREEGVWKVLHGILAFRAVQYP